MTLRAIIIGLLGGIAIATLGRISLAMARGRGGIQGFEQRKRLQGYGGGRQ